VRVSADRIVVVRAQPGVGDMLCAVPALRAVRGTAPRAHITLIGLPSARWLLERFHTYFNELLEFPGFPGLGDTEVDPRRTVEFFADAHERRFDLAIQLHDGGVAANAFTRLLGARTTAGSCPPEMPVPDREFYIPYSTDVPEAERLLRVLTNLGAHPPRGAEPEFPLSEDDRMQLAEAVEGEMLDQGAYACLHPGPGPTERFVALGEALHERGLRPVLIGGEEHRGVADGVTDALEPDALDLVGELTLGAAAALLRKATILIGDGLNLAHVAAAVRTPSVAIAAPGVDIERWRPQDRERHVVLSGDDDPTPDDVLRAAGELIGLTTA
jgi:ADP-heptose:LPS heptosyltransferase